MRVLSFILMALGLLSIAIAMVLFLLSALGHLGVLADVGPTENQAMSRQLLSMGIPPLIGGSVLFGLGLVVLVATRRRASADAM